MLKRLAYQRSCFAVELEASCRMSLSLDQHLKQSKAESMIVSQESEMIVALLFASLRLIDFISNLELSRVERIELKSSCFQVLLCCLLRWSMLESSTMSSSLLEGCLEM